MMHTRHSITETDADLASAWKAGDARAGDRLLARYLRELDGYFYLKVGPRNAEELRQETLLRVAGAIDKFRGESGFRTFLYAIAHHTLCDHLRARRTGRGVFDAGQCSLEEVLGELAVEPVFDRDARELLAALRALKVDEQELVSLRMIQGFSYKEIARILGASGSPGTLRTRVHAVRSKLQALLGVRGARHRGVDLDVAVLRQDLGPRLRWLGALIVAVLSSRQNARGASEAPLRA